MTFRLAARAVTRMLSHEGIAMVGSHRGGTNQGSCSADRSVPQELWPEQFHELP